MRRGGGTYTGSREEMHHVREVMQLMATLTGDNRFAMVADTEKAKNGEGGIHNMCEVLDAIEKRGYDRGIDQGEMQRARSVAIRMNEKGIPLDDIADIIGEDTATILEWLMTSENR